MDTGAEDRGQRPTTTGCSFTSTSSVASTVRPSLTSVNSQSIGDATLVTTTRYTQERINTQETGQVGGAGRPEMSRGLNPSMTQYGTLQHPYVQSGQPLTSSQPSLEIRRGDGITREPYPSIDMRAERRAMKEERQVPSTTHSLTSQPAPMSTSPSNRTRARSLPDPKRAGWNAEGFASTGCSPSPRDRHLNHDQEENALTLRKLPQSPPPMAQGFPEVGHSSTYEPIRLQNPNDGSRGENVPLSQHYQPAPTNLTSNTYIPGQRYIPAAAAAAPPPPQGYTPPPPQRYPGYGHNQLERQGNQAAPVMTDADMAWRGIPEGGAVRANYNSRERVEQPGLQPRILEARECTECIGFLIDHRNQDTRSKKQDIIQQLRPLNSPSSAKTVKGLAEAHLGHSLSQGDIDELCHPLSQRVPGDTCVHTVVRAMKSEGKKLGHLVHYFFKPENKRVDVLKIVREIHMNCAFCLSIFQQLP